MECGNREGVKASRTTRLLRDPRPRRAGQSVVCLVRGPQGHQRRVRPDPHRGPTHRPGGAARPARQDPRPGPAAALSPPHRSTAV